MQDSSKQKDCYGAHKTSLCEVFLMTIFCGQLKICIGESRRRMSPVFSLYVAVKHSCQNHLACSLQRSHNMCFCYNMSLHLLFLRQHSVIAGTGCPRCRRCPEPQRGRGKKKPQEGAKYTWAGTSAASTATQVCGGSLSSLSV